MLYIGRMPAKKPLPPLKKVTRGRRSASEKESGRWRLSIREVAEEKGGYQWTSYLLQGWKENGKWQRKRFKDRAQAEVFKSNLELQFLPTEETQRVVITGLSQARAREAETAFAMLDAVDVFRDTDGTPVPLSLTAAVSQYLARLRDAHAVERVPMLKALEDCVADKLARRKLRERSAVQLRSSVRLFTQWLTRLPRYTDESINPIWSPPVSEITADDLSAYLSSMRGKDGLPAATKTWNNTRGDIGGFFQWCMGREGRVPIRGTKRRWAHANPAHDVPTMDHEDKAPAILSVEQAEEFLRMLEQDFPKMVPLFAVALFAGIRPSRNGELFKLAQHPELLTPCREASGRPLLDLDRLTINIPPSISKTRQRRVVEIQPNLAAWLAQYGTDLLPVGAFTWSTEIRKRFHLEHDVLRHSFVTYLSATIGKPLTAEQAGNSEAIIKKHYQAQVPKAEAERFWSIMPKRAENMKES